MVLLGRKFLFAGIVTLSLQLASAALLNAQSNDQAKHIGNGVRAVCHFTGDAITPYELITLRPGAGSSHSGHGDVSPENGSCPSVLPMSWSGGSGKNGKTAVGKSASATTTTSSAQQGDKSVGINPSADEKKVAICHKEGDGVFHLNSISENALSAHLAHGDLYPDGGACAGGTTGGNGDVEPGANPEPVTMLLFGAGLAGIGYVSRRKLAKRIAEED